MLTGLLERLHRDRRAGMSLPTGSPSNRSGFFASARAATPAARLLSSGLETRRRYSAGAGTRMRVPIINPDSQLVISSNA